MAAGVLKSVRFTSSHELDFILHSPLCRENTGAPRAGDIEVYYRPFPQLTLDDLIVHADIWLDAETVFQKRTMFVGSVFAITPRAQVLDDYQYFTDMFIFYAPQPDGSEKPVRCPTGTVCENQIRRFHCAGAMDDLIVARTHDQFLLLANREILNIEVAVENMIFSKTTEVAVLRARLAAVRGRLSPWVYHAAGDQFAKRYLLLAIDSLNQQLDLAEQYGAVEIAPSI